MAAVGRDVDPGAGDEIDGAVAEHGRLDIMGNIAGVPHNRMVAEVSDEEFERILAINMKSVFYGCQAAIRHMIPQGSGNIVNIYRTPAVHGLHRLVLTNTTATTPYRGAARPNVSYMMERLVDEAAIEMGIDRVELRRRNLIPKEAFPYKTPTGNEYDSGDPAGLLDDVLRHSDYAGFEKRRAEARARGKLRGISVCTFVEPAGGGGSPVEETAIQFGAAGTGTAATPSTSIIMSGCASSGTATSVRAGGLPGPNVRAEISFRMFCCVMSVR